MNNVKQYVGVQILHAEPMKRADYCKLRGWDLPTNENGEDEGFLVENRALARNTAAPPYSGHISWQTKEQFNQFRPHDKLTFGQAVELLKTDYAVARKNWNGANQFLFMIQGSNDFARLKGYGFGEMMGEPTFRDAIFLRTTDNQLVPWVASQSDILGDDWMIVGHSPA
jgi:hypothetical protein